MLENIFSPFMAQQATGWEFDFALLAGALACSSPGRGASRSIRFWDYS